VPIVFDPLQYIAMHIIEAEFIGLLFANGMQLSARIIIIPSNPVQILLLVSTVIPCLLASPAGILPLGFTWKLQACPASVLLGILPAHTDHRLPGLIELAVPPKLRLGRISIFSQKTAVLLVGHRITTYI
jgi:hypothetical protein